MTDEENAFVAFLTYETVEEGEREKLSSIRGRFTPEIYTLIASLVKSLSPVHLYFPLSLYFGPF